VLNGEYGRELDGKGVVNVPAGAVVSISAPPDIEDNKKKKLVFQKWMSSSAKADLGQDFKVGASETQFAMPAEKLAMTATYVDESTCGRLRAFFWEANEVHVGWSDELAEDVYIYPPYEAFEWTPDGKTWYKCGDSALLKAGSYTVSWRSTDPRWSAPSLREKVKVEAGEESSPMSISIFYTYVPQVVVDVVTFENGELRKSSAGGTFTMNPKDGLVPMDKTAALTAKANKNYSFQGWALAKGWEYGDCFEEKSADWKLVNCSGDSYPATEGRLNRYIDPDDGMVHVLAVFKALDDYSADDIEFYGFSGYNPANDVSYDGDGNASFTMKAVAGCALDEDVIAIDCAPGSFPLSYKLNGKLPDGLKFDAKTGVLSGAPKKAGTSTVTIVATDPAKNSKALTVNFDVAPLPSWLAGEYRGIMSEERFIGGHNEWDEESQQFVYVPMEILPGPQNGILELSVKSDGKVSAKVVTGLGARSVSGTLVWFDPEARDDDVEGEFAEFRFYHYAKDDSECHVYFYSDGTIDGYADSYDKVNDSWAGGDMTGLRQAAEQMADSPFLDKYYTFAFSAEAEKDEETMQSGYGYLTIKTDKKGAAKVTGQLPDGEKVSMSAIVMPFVTNDVLKARLYLFASPSSYKKRDWFAMSLLISPDGTVVSEENAAWTPGVGTVCQEEEYGNAELLRQEAQVYGVGALYSEAKSLEDYYWTVHCDYSGDVALEYSWKELYYNDITGKDEPYTAYGYANALDFGGFFNVSVKGDKKGAISLAGKSPAPWVNKVDGESYWEFGVDKKGNEITDPSQLSISFTKATGIFTGKASVYFDEPKPTSASLPYAGVMIHGGDGIYEGFGSAVYSFKYSYEDDKGKQKTNTDKITLPVSLVPGFSNGGE
jgi:hypothetical protein